MLKEKRLCVPCIKALMDNILEKAHSSAYMMDPGSTKMYRTLKYYYWWRSMQREVAEFVAKCSTSQTTTLEDWRVVVPSTIF